MNVKFASIPTLSAVISVPFRVSIAFTVNVLADGSKGKTRAHIVLRKLPKLCLVAGSTVFFYKQQKTNRVLFALATHAH